MSMLKTTISSPTDTEKTPKTLGNFSFLTPEAKLAFSGLRLAFTKAPILYHFDPKRYIWIKTDTSDYIIGDFLSQLTSESG